MSKTNNRIITTIILATIFGLSGGMVGSIIARVYILEKTLNIPLMGEIDFLENNYGGPSIIIRGAKKVVVEQNTKVIETVNAVEKSIVGIYKSKPVPATVEKTDRSGDKNNFNINDYYLVDDNLGQGFILTSDGWIITEVIPEKLNYLPPPGNSGYIKKKKDILNGYVVVLKDKKVYPVDDIVLDGSSDYAYWRIPANDLPVRGFSREKEIKNGQLAVVVKWNGWIWLTNIIGRKDDRISITHNSDKLSSKLLLSEKSGVDFNSSFLFDLNGNLYALIDKAGNVDPIYKYTAVISYLLRHNRVKRASLGINYIDLSELINDNISNEIKGALVYKNNKGVAVKRGGAAALAGLREGDIIKSVDNVELNNNIHLNSIIVQKVPGDEINLEYLRQGQSMNAKVVLDEL